MSPDPLTAISTRATPQSEAIPGSSQVPNSAGGYGWAVDDWARLRRFLILGVDGGSYYASERALTRQNAEVVLRCAESDGPRTVAEIVAVSEAGRNPRQQPVIFALAVCAGAGQEATRAAALAALPRVCRTGTHLFLFAGYVEQFRGWGRALRRAMGDWYLDKDTDALAYQLVKYQQREGWSHRDVLRLAKPRPERGCPTDLALAWATGHLSAPFPPGTPAILRAHHEAQSSSAARCAQVAQQSRLPWEALPSEALRDAAVWEALLPAMGLGAIVRNLGRMTANGTFGNPLLPARASGMLRDLRRKLAPTDATDASALDLVLARLADVEAIRRARLHPIAILSALRTYRSGGGVRGSLRWDPLPALVDALDAAFYTAFGALEPAGRRTMLALDVSASMGWSTIAGVPGLTPRLGSAAMAAVTLATEPEVTTVAFTNKLTPLPLSRRQRLDDIVAAVDNLDFGSTDCALPMLYALQRGLAIDTFVVYTDSETWAGEPHPAQALARYRERTGIPARLIVVAMVANKVSIADPDDAGMLDVVGFDTAAPQLMADFSAGRL